MMCQALDQSLTAQDTESVERLRHHPDFCFALAGIVQPAARIWLQGWLEAMGRIPDRPGPDNPF